MSGVPVVLVPVQIVVVGLAWRDKVVGAEAEGWEVYWSTGMDDVVLVVSVVPVSVAAPVIAAVEVERLLVLVEELKALELVVEVNVVVAEVTLVEVDTALGVAETAAARLQNISHAPVTQGRGRSRARTHIVPVKATKSISI